MIKQRRLRSSGVVAGILLIGLVAAVTGQSARPGPPTAKATLDDVVAEVRELRGEIKETAGASIRMQLLVARLQLQEQRVNAAARQLADVRERLASLQQGQTTLRERLAAAEAAQQRLPPEDRSDYQAQALKLQIEQGQSREQELRAQESALSGLLAAEQSRWVDFNNRLDALEQSLPAAIRR